MLELSNPFAPRVVERRGAPYWLVVALASVVGAGAAGAGFLYFGAPSAGATVVDVRPTPTVLTAVKDIARLEVTEVQVEKVIDISERQKVVFGLLDGEDNMLLVAAGSATIGVDFEKLGDDDVTFDERTGVARLRLPPPEVFSSRLDPDNTYVYRRETSVLAKRNERLEGRARKEATDAVEEAASKPEVIERAKVQAEKQLTALLGRVGVKRVEITWERGSKA